MTIACPAPDETLGVVLRLSAYLDCQARALGENGFEALTGGPIVSGVLDAAITIFVALIGYRLILGSSPSLRDGVGWAVRLGFVLALATSWPAFQTLVYRVATDAPQEIAATLLPAAGLPSDDVEARTQAAYDAIRRGVYTTADAEQAQPQPQVPADASQASEQTPPAQTQTFGIGLSASPVAASALAFSSVGVAAALRLTAGLLVAIGPLAIVALLFDATAGLVASWARALGAAALGVLATSLTSSLQIVAVESEIARAGDIQSGLLPATAADPQAFVTIAAIFGLIPLILVYAMFRATGGLRLRLGSQGASQVIEKRQDQVTAGTRTMTGAMVRPAPADAASRTRAVAISDALTSAAHRDLRLVETGANTTARRQPLNSSRTERPVQVAPLGSAGRRTSARRSRAASRRDRPA